MVPGTYVLLNLNNDEGWRGWVILSQGDRWAKLLSPATLETRTIPADDLDRLEPAQVGTFSPARLAARLRAKMVEAARYGWRFSQRNAERAAAMMDDLATDTVEATP